METCVLCLLFLGLCFPLLHGKSVKQFRTWGTTDGSEEWGYVEVRPKAHMFWWLYRSPNRVESGPTPWPTVLWLQGGPGASAVGIGNFQEIGPLDTDLKPRNSTWLQKADLLFVDNPVGAGYSFVEDEAALATTDEHCGIDLTTLLKMLFNGNAGLQKSPLFVVAESYGGKFAVTVGLSIAKAIKAGELNLTLGGIALGDSWISPEDFVLTWGTLLRDVSRLDINGEKKSNSLAQLIKKQLGEGEYTNATSTWAVLEEVIASQSNNVDFYNFLLDNGMDPLGSMAIPSTLSSGKMTMKGYSSYLSSKYTSKVSLDDLMNGVIKQKLKIIPKDMSWGEQYDMVFNAMSGDFMKPRIKEVDELLSMGVNVTIYNGQVDLICATKGTEAWVQKLKWEGLADFNNAIREPLYCGNYEGTKAFAKSYKNLHFYWILEAGHFVPVDQPCVALQMVSEITRSPARSSAAVNLK